MNSLETIVRKQAEAILSPDVLHTKDVFFSQNAVNEEQFNDEVSKAVKRFNLFADAVENADLDENILISECVSSDTVQYIFELNSYELTVDFLKRKIIITDDRINEITPDELQISEPVVYDLYNMILSMFSNIDRY